jgi:hypothetical protein
VTGLSTYYRKQSNLNQMIVWFELLSKNIIEYILIKSITRRTKKQNGNTAKLKLIKTIKSESQVVSPLKVKLRFSDFDHA